MSHTRMATLPLILSELLPLDGFRCNCMSALVYYHDTLQLCRTHFDGVLGTRLTTLTFILSELFPLDCFRCNSMSAP